MIEIANLEEHIKQITKEEWNGLFSLIPEITNTTDFGGSLNNAKIVSQTLNSIYNLNLLPVFNWLDWEFGKEILTTTNFNYTNLNKITLCKLLTCIVRSNRFNEGYTLNCFKENENSEMEEQEKLRNTLFFLKNNEVNFERRII